MKTVLRWRLRECMAKAKIKTYTQLANELTAHGHKTSKVSVMKLVKNRPKRISVATLETLCAVLGCRFDELFEQTWATGPQEDILPFPLPPKVAIGKRRLQDCS